MTDAGQSALPPPRALSRAIRERNVEAIESLLHPEVVLNSPITSSFRFEGRATVLALLKLVSETIEDLEESEHLPQADEHGSTGLRFRGRIGDQPLEGVDLMRVDGDGKVREITVFIRPLPGLTALLASLAADVARPTGPWRAAAAGFSARLLAKITRGSDRISAKLVAPEKLSA